MFVREQHLLNRVPFTTVLRCNQAKRFTLCTGARCTANTVDVIFRYLWQIIVNHMLYMRHIKATCNNVSCNKNAECFAAIGFDNAITLALFQITMNGISLIIMILQLSGEFICTAFCFHKNDHRTTAHIKFICQNFIFLILINAHNFLVDILSHING